MVSPDFNDLNLEEESRYCNLLLSFATKNLLHLLFRYIAHAGKCHYIVDLENSAVSDLQPRYADHGNWTAQVRRLLNFYASLAKSR